ncbi:Ferric siderophore transport system, periplasmic-binding protein TonB [Cystobacter fuscus]|uniref:Ferric siderophore transport system, periplasmic-binding protein TonB n=1 Tax=Cystobacter fuscus TaxID=43 RepID=A0A250IY90_9BACT|nr:energy transducer TonB [Cystobacter fuscus]ATB36715.1 Ferric siderophore transport system, periplasmic-binding protein TonB [Cystobacter fuscus]
MFDSVLDRGQGPKSRFGVGAVVSVVLHVALVGGIAWLSMRPPKEEEKEVEVTFKQAMAPPVAAPPPPPPPPPPASKKTPTKKPTVKKPDTIVQPKEIPQEKPPEVEPEPAAEEEEATEEEVEGGVEGGVAGGVVGGVIGGVVGGVLGGQVGGTGTDVLPFGAGMTRPEKLSGPQPQYTREALEAHVQGLMIVKCVITTEGKVERCRIIKPLPHMEQAVLDSLYAQRYKPVTFQGRPVQVDYTFNIRLSMPR